MAETFQRTANTVDANLAKIGIPGQEENWELERRMVRLEIWLSLGWPAIRIMVSMRAKVGTSRKWTITGHERGQVKLRWGEVR